MCFRVSLFGAKEPNRAAMQFIVEIVSCVAQSQKVLGQVQIDEPSRRKARTKAHLLLAPWRIRGATCAHLLDRRGNRLNAITSARRN